MRDPRHIEVPDMSHMMPMRISVSKAKAMSDSELLAALNGEDGRKGMMTMQSLQLITSELQARSIERAGKPHWSTVPSFWLLVGSLVISLAALAVAVIALPPQVQQPVSASPPPPQTPSLGQSTQASSPPAPTSKQRR